MRERDRTPNPNTNRDGKRDDKTQDSGQYRGAKVPSSDEKSEDEGDSDYTEFFAFKEAKRNYQKQKN